MGATIALEFLNEYAQERRNATMQGLPFPTSPRSNSQLAKANVCGFLTEKAAAMLEHGLVQLITVGSALNWHHPIRPFLRTMNFSIPWLNLHYHNDVLASALRHQGEETSHVEDFEVFPLTTTSKTTSVYERLQQAAFVALRMLPACHMCYFFDPAVFETMNEHIQRALVTVSEVKCGKRAKRIWSTPPPSSADLFGKGN